MNRYKRVLRLIWSLLKTRRLLFLAGFLLVIINRMAGLALPASTRFVIDNILGKREIYKLPWVVVLLLLATVIQSMASLGVSHILSKGGQKMIAELRIRIQAHIGLLPVSFYDENRVGTLVSRIMSDVEGVRSLLGTGFVEFLGSLVTSLFALILLLRINVFMTLSTAVFIAIFVYLFARQLKILWPIYDQRSRTLAEVTGRLAESLGGVRIVKGFDAEAHESEEFAMGITRILAVLIRAISAEGVLAVLSQVTASGLGIWVLYEGIHLVIQGQLTLGGYFTYNLLLVYMIAPLTMAVSSGMQLTEAVVGVHRALDVLEREREHETPERITEIGDIRGRVAFDHVIFGYDKNKPVLHNISFVAQPNQVLALVGPSGSGKSTMASLICAFHTPQAGQVTVDGIDLSNVKLSSYRRQLGVVLQDSFLFQGTIRENVVFAKLDATEEQVLTACRLAGVSDFAEQFPDKYETVVGERGVRLSGGQKQRIAIARALLVNPRILILDEATSNLDFESEQMIQAGLTHLMRDRTTVIIAHRLSMVQSADQILVIENGRIAERGTHDSLYASSSAYRKLYDNQRLNPKLAGQSQITA